MEKYSMRTRTAYEPIVWDEYLPSRYTGEIHQQGSGFVSRLNYKQKKSTSGERPCCFGMVEKKHRAELCFKKIKNKAKKNVCLVLLSKPWHKTVIWIYLKDRVQKKKKIYILYPVYSSLSLSCSSNAICNCCIRQSGQFILVKGHKNANKVSWESVGLCPILKPF